MGRTHLLPSVFMHADRTDKMLMALGVVGSMGNGFSAPLMVLLTSKTMNDVGTGLGDDRLLFRQTINKNAVGFVYMACASFCVCFLEGYCWTRTAERQASRMRHVYLKAILRQDVVYFDLKLNSTSEVVTTVSNDSLVIQNAISEKVPHFLMNLFLFLGSYIAATLVMWRLAIVGFPFAVLLIIPGLIYGRILMRLTRRIREEYRIASSVVEQAISSIRTVYSFVGENKTMNEFSSALQGTVKLGLDQGLAKGVAIGSNGVIFVVWAFMSWYGSRLVMYHHAKGGAVFAVGALITIGGLALGSALSDMKHLLDAYSAGERIMEVIKRAPRIDTDNMEGEVLPDVSGKVEFKNVKFSYPSRPESIILEDFSLKVPAGKTVAVVGGSGSGKSTVFSLLLRFYDPTKGEILLDGVSINQLQLKWVRSQMGLVSQEPSLFATTIKENILFGKEDATDEELIAAIKASNAHHFISQLPQGYDTQVGERGIQISGGEKQRIAIARAIIKVPRILLLDEATSALDSESERIVQEALDKASFGRTTIVIAHRLSTIRNADVIAVVQNGQVTETGSHDELIKDKNGFYSSLLRLQQTNETTEKDNNNTTGSPKLSISKTSFWEEQDNSKEEENRNRTPPAPSFRRLLILNISEWRQGCLGSISAILFGAVQPSYAFVLGSVLSVYFLTDHDEIRSKIRMHSVFFLGLAVLSLLLGISQHYFFASMGEYLTKRVREKMLLKILTFEVGWFDQKENSSGAVCSRLAKDASVVRSLVGDRMSLIIQTCSAVTVAGVMGLIIAWRLAIIMIAAQPLIIVCLYQRKVLLQRMSSKAIASQEESSKLAAEAVSNFRTITAFSSQSRILDMLARAQDGPRRESIRQSWFAGLGLGLAQSLMSCTYALDFWYGGKLIYQGYITAKELFQTFLVLISTGRVIADAGSMTNDLVMGANVITSVFAVLDRSTRIEPKDKEGHKPERLIGDIEFHGVYFAYPARPNVVVFKGLYLSIEAGTSTAFVGQSGSGKSTIVALIERFYDPLKGSVKIDGRDVRSYHLMSLRKHIALVSQEPTMFSGTIKENIVYGAPDKVDAAEIVGAARAASAHDFIAGLKDGYETQCGDRGIQLSGGQKQRIAIARAILKCPAMMLLDEATSALDSQSERDVQEALDHVMVGRTSVVVAHRLSTIYNCNQIVVLDKGTVLEKGTHSSLLAKTGTYHRLVSFQQGKCNTNRAVN